MGLQIYTYMHYGFRSVGTVRRASVATPRPLALFWPPPAPVTILCTVWGDLLGGRAGGVAPLLPPVRAGRPSAAQAHRLRHPRVEVRLLRRGRRPALLALGKHVATFFSTFACNLGWSVSSTFRDICLEIKSNAVTRRATCREHVGTFTLAALVGHTRGGGPL